MKLFNSYKDITMKYYDYERAEKLIRLLRMIIGDNFTAILAMQEDYDWTNEVVYKNGKLFYNLNKKPFINGIQGSYWATPILLIKVSNLSLPFSMYRYEE